MKLAPVRVFSCKHPLNYWFTCGACLWKVQRPEPGIRHFNRPVKHRAFPSPPPSINVAVLFKLIVQKTNNPTFNERVEVESRLFCSPWNTPFDKGVPIILLSIEAWITPPKLSNATCSITIQSVWVLDKKSFGLFFQDTCSLWKGLTIICMCTEFVLF